MMSDSGWSTPTGRHAATGSSSYVRIGLAGLLLVLALAACGVTHRTASPASSPPCTTAPPETPGSTADPRAAAFLSASHDVNGAQRDLESQRLSARTVAQQQGIDRSNVEALHQLQLRIYAIDFPPRLHTDVSGLLRAIREEQTAYIHAAGSPVPDDGARLAQIDQDVEHTQAASNQLRHDLGLPPTRQCV